jgi:alkaline phosphatase
MAKTLIITTIDHRRGTATCQSKQVPNNYQPEEMTGSGAVEVYQDKFQRAEDAKQYIKEMTTDTTKQQQPDKINTQGSLF